MGPCTSSDPQIGGPPAVRKFEWQRVTSERCTSSMAQYRLKRKFKAAVLALVARDRMLNITFTPGSVASLQSRRSSLDSLPSDPTPLNRIRTSSLSGGGMTNLGAVQGDGIAGIDSLDMAVMGRGLSHALGDQAMSMSIDDTGFSERCASTGPHRLLCRGGCVTYWAERGLQRMVGEGRMLREERTAAAAAAPSARVGPWRCPTPPRSGGVPAATPQPGPVAGRAQACFHPCRGNRFGLSRRRAAASRACRQSRP